jgi:hypothetical protein
MSQTSATTVAAVTSPMPGWAATPCPVITGEGCSQIGVGSTDLDGDGVDQPQARIQPTAGAHR